jgi:hypothetical protein
LQHKGYFACLNAGGFEHKLHLSHAYQTARTSHPLRESSAVCWIADGRVPIGLAVAKNIKVSLKDTEIKTKIR